MFSYFKKKQQQNTDKRSRQVKNDHSTDINGKDNNGDNVIRLPSHIMEQLLNNNLPQEKEQRQVRISHASQDQVQYHQSSQLFKKLQNLNKTPNVQNKTQLPKATQKINQEALRMPNLPDICENETLKQVKVHSDQILLTGQTQGLQKTQQADKNKNKNTRLFKRNQGNSNNQSKRKISQSSSPLIKKYIIPPTLLTEQIQPLISSIINILFEQIQSQLINQPISLQKLTSKLTLSTLQTLQQVNSQFYESQILQTKQKYNNLVEQSTNLFSKSRKIANIINEFIMSINLFLQSEELIIPCQQIHKSIAELNPERTQKYVNYLIKIFEANFDDVIERRVKQMKSKLQTQLRRQQKAKRQLQNQLRGVKQQYKLKQSTFYEQTLRSQEKQQQVSSLKRQVQQLSNKFNSVASTSISTKQDFNSQLLLLKRQLQRSKKQFQESRNTIAKLSQRLQKKQKAIEQKQSQIEKLGQVIKKVKAVQDEGMENLAIQMEQKQRMFRNKMERFNQEKIALQNKIKTFRNQYQSQRNINKQLTKQCQQLRKLVLALKDQMLQLKGKLQSQKKQQPSSQQKQINILQNTLSFPDQPTLGLSQLVNKQILAHLFLSFDDQSKQWSIRNNIRNQIYILLDIKKGGAKQAKQLNVKSNKNFESQRNAIANNVGQYKVNSKQNNNAAEQQKKVKDGSIIGKWLGW